MFNEQKGKNTPIIRKKLYPVIPDLQTHTKTGAVDRNLLVTTEKIDGRETPKKANARACKLHNHRTKTRFTNAKNTHLLYESTYPVSHSPLFSMNKPHALQKKTAKFPSGKPFHAYSKVKIPARYLSVTPRGIK